MDSQLKYFHLLCVLICMLASCQCQFDAQQPPKVSASLHLFANDLYQALDRFGGNVVASPLSVFTSLSMISLAAKGLTLDQLQRTLRLSPESLSTMSAMIASFQDVEGFDMANLMWVPRGVVIRRSFADQMNDIFQTKVREADFRRSDLVRSFINRRIGDVTHGKIQDFLPPGAVGQDTKAMLANVVYFKGAWLHAFDESDTQEKPFFTGRGQSIDVPTMHQKNLFVGGIFQDLDAQAVFMPYADNRFGLLMVLPNRYDGIDELEAQLIGDAYTPTLLMRRMFHRDVDISMPRFNIEYGSDLSPILRRMGIEELFSARADLSGMSRSPLAQMMPVSRVFHRATFEVNEGGSEASAASGLEIIPLSGSSEGPKGPIKFLADHPFVFYLIDRDSENLPIFMGRVVNPLLDGSGPSLSALSIPSDDSFKEFTTDEVIYPEPADSSNYFRQRRDSETLAEGSFNITDLILRVKDKNWFKKPTVSNVIIPNRRNPPNSGPTVSTGTQQPQDPTTQRPTTQRPTTTRTNRPRPTLYSRTTTRRYRQRTTTSNGFQPGQTTTIQPPKPSAVSFSFGESEEERYSPNQPSTPNTQPPTIHQWPNLQPSQPNQHGLFHGLFRPLPGWPISALPGTESGLPAATPGFNNGQPALPGYNNGQPALPGYNNGQPALPGYNNGQSASPGFNNGQFPSPDNGDQSSVLFPNLRIITKQLGDQISATLGSLTGTLKGDDIEQ